MLFHLYKNAPHPPALPVIRSVPLSNVPSMITSTTSNKLAEIIRDTWPNLYRPPADFKPPALYNLPEVSYNNQKTSKHEQV